MPKPFDLKVALAGKPVLGPDGKLVRRLIHVPERAWNYNLLVVLHDGSTQWFMDGGNSGCSDSLTMADLPKRKVSGWINIYKYGSYVTSGRVYDSKVDADAVCGADNIQLRTAVIPISFEVEDEE